MKGGGLRENFPQKVAVCRPRWGPGELVAYWGPTEAERKRLPGCVDHNRLSFAAHLKFFKRERPLFQVGKEIPAATLSGLTTQLCISLTALAR
jgi:hypothetical protein